MLPLFKLGKLSLSYLLRPTPTKFLQFLLPQLTQTKPQLGLLKDSMITLFHRVLTSTNKKLLLWINRFLMLLLKCLLQLQRSPLSLLLQRFPPFLLLLKSQSFLLLQRFLLSPLSLKPLSFQLAPRFPLFQLCQNRPNHQKFLLSQQLQRCLLMKPQLLMLTQIQPQTSHPFPLLSHNKSPKKNQQWLLRFLFPNPTILKRFICLMRISQPSQMASIWIKRNRPTTWEGSRIEQHARCCPPRLCLPHWITHQYQHWNYSTIDGFFEHRGLRRYLLGVGQ